MNLTAAATFCSECILGKIPKGKEILNFAYYERLVDKEIKLAGITEKDKILCIGGGPFPITAINLAEKTGASITVVDKDERALKKAKRLIKGSSIENKIHFKLQNGQDIDPNEYTVIHVARQVEPQVHVVRELVSKAKRPIRLIVRCYKDYMKDYQRYFKEIKCQRDALFSTKCTFLYSRGHRVYEKETYPRYCNYNTLNTSAG